MDGALVMGGYRAFFIRIEEKRVHQTDAVCHLNEDRLQSLVFFNRNRAVRAKLDRLLSGVPELLRRTLD
jgi:hypothetical protein